MFNYTEEFIIDSDHILTKKNKTDDGLYLYTFKSLEDETNEKKGYLKNQHKKNSFDNDKLNVKTIALGTISFISNLDFNPKDIYKMYETRWEIELFFNFYKNVAGLESVRVQDNTSIIGSEFINFISSVISIRIKKEFIKTKLYDKYSYCQIMDKLGQLDVYLDANSNKWVPTNKIKYIEEIAKTLNLYSA